jgi:HK97 family phage major capsid protein/HK97 family phage prohead protease
MMSDDNKILARELVGSKVLQRSLTLERAGVDEDARTVNISISSEEPYERWFGVEILGHEEKHVNLEFLSSGKAPLLLDHDARQQIGVIETVYIDSETRTLRGKVRFGKKGLADDVFGDVVDGIRSNISVGYHVNEMELVSRDEEGVGTYRVTSWRPVEASIVSIPADPTVGIERGDLGKKPAEAKQVSAREDLPMSDNLDDVIVGGKSDAPFQISDEMKSQFDAQKKAAVEAARRETGSIYDLAARHNQRQLADEFVRDGRGLDEFRGALLEKIGNKPLESNEVGLDKKEAKQFSLLRMANFLANPSSRAARDAARFEMEVVEAAGQKHGNAKGHVIPVDVLNTWGQRDLSVGSDGNIVFDDNRPGSFIDILRNSSSVMQAGATVLNGLQGDVKIPKKATTSAPGWVSSEGGAVGETEPTFGQVSMAPKLVGGYTDVTRQLMQQSSIDVESLIRADLAATIALGIDLGGLEGSGASGQPTGIKNTSGINAPTAFAAVNPTFAEVVAMETAVAEDNALQGNLAYILGATMRGALKTTVMDAGSGRFVYENDMMNGYRGIMSNQTTAGDLYFGNFSDLLMGFWSGLDILVDPYTASTSGTVRIVAMQTVDVAVRHAVSFAVNNDGA